MSTPTPSPAGYTESSSDETMTTVGWVGGGTLLLLTFLAFLCVGGFLLSSVVAGSPITDFMMTPVGK